MVSLDLPLLSWWSQRDLGISARETREAESEGVRGKGVRYMALREEGAGCPLLKLATIVWLIDA